MGGMLRSTAAALRFTEAIEVSLPNDPALIVDDYRGTGDR